MGDIYHYINGAIVSEDDATISALDLGILRGYGVFDYVQSYKGIPFHLMDHLLRLEWSCQQIELHLPLSLDKIYNITLDLIEKNNRVDAGIRFIVTGGNVSKDLLVGLNKSSLLILFHPFTPLPERYYTQGMKVVTTKLLRLLPGVKTTNYIPAILAMNKAQNLSFDDAIYINDQDEILEATTSNAFFFKNGTWITSDSNQIVKGVTRMIIIKLLSEDYPLEYRSLPVNEIESCEEAFLCSSVKDAISLTQIDHFKIGSGLPGIHTSRICNKYRNYISNYLNNNCLQEASKLC